MIVNHEHLFSFRLIILMNWKNCAKLPITSTSPEQNPENFGFRLKVLSKQSTNPQRTLSSQHQSQTGTMRKNLN